MNEHEESSSEICMSFQTYTLKRGCKPVSLEFFTPYGTTAQPGFCQAFDAVPNSVDYDRIVRFLQGRCNLTSAAALRVTLNLVHGRSRQLSKRLS